MKIRLGKQADRQRWLRKCKQRGRKPLTELPSGRRELGYVEGQNIVNVYRYAEGKPDRLPILAAELVHHNGDLIVTAGPAPTSAGKEALSRFPSLRDLRLFTRSEGLAPPRPFQHIVWQLFISSLFFSSDYCAYGVGRAVVNNGLLRNGSISVSSETGSSPFRWS